MPPSLTQYIECGFENIHIIGVVFVDLTVAFDTINYRKILLKVAKILSNNNIINVIQPLLSNRLFFVEIDGKKADDPNRTMDYHNVQYLPQTLQHLH